MKLPILSSMYGRIIHYSAVAVHMLAALFAGATTGCTHKPLKPTRPRTPTAGTPASVLEGTWYTVARPNYSNARGVTRESLTFRRKKLHHWQVIYRGWRNDNGNWTEKRISAKETASGRLAGTFFDFIPSDISIVSMDKEKRCALLAGSNRREFLIISRDETPVPAAIEALLSEAQRIGFPVEETLFLQYR